MTTPDKPSFIIDTEAELGAIREIDEFYTMIEHKPDIMKEAVARYAGMVIMKATVESTEREQDKPKPKVSEEEQRRQEAAKIAREHEITETKGNVRHFFENRLDREVEFDHHTYVALSKDEKYLELVGKFEEAKKVPESKGNSPGMAQSRENRRLRISDAQKDISYYSLIFFVERMETFNTKAESPPTPLAEAV